MNEDFWLDSSNWPEDHGDYVFLGRAVVQIAQRQFGQHWSIDNPNGHFSYEDNYGSTETDDPDLEEALWDEQEIQQAEDEKTAIEQLEQVASFIAKQCKSGQLASGLRDIGGGQITALDASAWNTEAYLWRFDECKMSAVDHFYVPPRLRTEKILINRARPAVGRRWHVMLPSLAWIFVNRIGLKAILKRFPPLSKANRGYCEAQYENWLTATLPNLNHKEIGRPAIEEQYKKAQRTIGSNISTHGFERVWAKVTSVEKFKNFRKQGRKTKRNS